MSGVEIFPMAKGGAAMDPVSERLARMRAEACDLARSGLSIKSIADRFGVSRRRVNEFLQRSGMELGKRRSSDNQARRARVAKFLKTPQSLDLSDRDIARRLGVGVKIVEESWVEHFAAIDGRHRGDDLDLQFGRLPIDPPDPTPVDPEVVERVENARLYRNPNALISRETYSVPRVYKHHCPRRGYAS